MKLTTPLSKDDVRKLHVGDTVELSGLIITARDVAHKYLVEQSAENLPFDLNGAVIYHCGPIVKDNEVLAAGPTTSIREEPYEADVIEKYQVSAIIGKGGMGEKTLNAMKQEGAVYLTAVGGAAVKIAKSIQKINTVHMKDEFGSPEAFWIFDVKDLPLVVSMDSYGESLYKQVEEKSKVKLGEYLK